MPRADDSGPYQIETASPLELAKAVCEDEPATPSAAALLPSPARHALSGDLDNIVLMALRKEPESAVRLSRAVFQ
jgi:hypothetical protein